MFLLVFFFVSLAGKCQGYYTVFGADNTAMGGTGVAGINLWSANNNQAAMAFYEPSFGAGFYYQNGFMTKENSLSGGALVYPVKSGTFGLTISNFGYSGFNTKKVGLGFGKKLSKNFSAGVQIDYINIFIGDNYGSRGYFTFEAGMLVKVKENFTVGAHVFNPVRVKLADYNDERMPLIMNAGVNWQAAKNLTLTAEAQSDLQNKMILKAGLQYLFGNIVYARIGVSNNPNIFSFGAGLHLGNLRLDFSSTMHQVLGYSPQFSLVYEFD